MCLVSTRLGQDYPEYETFLQAWRQRARPTFLRFSAVVALVVIPCARYVLDIGFQVRCASLCPSGWPFQRGEI